MVPLSISSGLQTALMIGFNKEGVFQEKDLLFFFFKLQTP